MMLQLQLPLMQLSAVAIAYALRTIIAQQMQLGLRASVKVCSRLSTPSSNVNLLLSCTRRL